MTDTATLILQYRSVAVQGLLVLREVTIDLPRLTIPDPDDGKPPKELERTMSLLVSHGIAERRGLCVSIRPDLHGGIIRRCVLINRAAAEAELKHLKTVLGSAYMAATPEQIEAAKPSGLHLPYSEFGNGGFLFNPFPDTD